MDIIDMAKELGNALKESQQMVSLKKSEEVLMQDEKAAWRIVEVGDVCVRALLAFSVFRLGLLLEPGLEARHRRSRRGLEHGGLIRPDGGGGERGHQHQDPEDTVRHENLSIKWAEPERERAGQACARVHHGEQTRQGEGLSSYQGSGGHLRPPHSDVWRWK